MPSVTLVRHTFLPLESIQLGRLVRNVDEPQSEYLDPDLAIRLEPIVKPYHRYQEAQQDKTQGNFGILLTSLASASRTRRNKRYTHVATDRVTTYQLDNSGSWFKAAIQTEKTRQWIQESIDQGDDVFLVVGYYTMVDAEIVEGADVAVDASAGLNLPVSAALAATGMLPMGGVADPKIEGRNGGQQGTNRRFVAPGEQICAVQYRKLSFKWYSSRDVDRAFLEREHRWKMYSNIRGQEVGTNDIVEVDLQDELELEGDYEKYAPEADGQFLL